MKDLYYGLASGSTGNSGLLVLDNICLLIDVGISVRRLKGLLETFGLTIADLDAILITHEHTDHIKGLATLIKNYQTPIYTACGTADVLLAKYPNIRDQLRPFYHGAAFEIGGVKVQSFPTPHDAADSVGYRLTGSRISFGYLTDLGFVSAAVREAMLGCDAAVLESNHDPDMLRNGPYPYHLQERVSGPRGHLSNFECARFAVELAREGAEQLILSHLSDKNNTPAMAQMETEAALMADRLHCAMYIAPKNEMTAPVWLQGKEDTVCYPSA